MEIIQYIDKFIKFAIEASSAEVGDYKTINLNHNKMKNIVKKIFELKKEKYFFDSLFNHNDLSVRRWGASFSEIFNYDINKSYEIFVEASKSKLLREIDRTGAKIAVERLEQKISLNK